ncbi:MAG TPA: hypothetical protein VNL73_02720, partial [Verrucomicrobiae bacterium]|nr:hypothetical protein [Verrucomicrobiae bacterium]
MGETAQNTKKQPKQEVDGKLEWLREHGFIRSLEKHNGKGQVVATEEVVIYKGLLALAHEDGLKRLVTELVDFPSDVNRLTAIFEAEAETNRGVFRCHGDANPENVDEQIAPHYIRVAETRAKARVLRDALNIGLVCAEEFGLEVGANGVLSVRATNGKLKVLPKEKPESQPKASPAATSSPEPEKPKASPAGKVSNGPKASAKPKVGSETKPPAAKPEPEPS